MVFDKEKHVETLSNDDDPVWRFQGQEQHPVQWRKPL